MSSDSRRSPGPEGRLETARLGLEPWSDAHTALLVELSAIPEVMRFVGSGAVWSAARAEEVAAIQRDRWARHGFGWRAAVRRETGAAVGFVALNFAEEGATGLEPGEHEIGWWLLPDAWGQGLAREGAAAVRDDAFRTLGAPSVAARVRPTNERSIEVAKSLGLTLDFETVDDGGREVSVYRLLA
jgi:RimJ/RimL family protein N-acetyltransferase